MCVRVKRKVYSMCVRNRGVVVKGGRREERSTGNHRYVQDGRWVACREDRESKEQGAKAEENTHMCWSNHHLLS